MRYQVYDPASGEELFAGNSKFGAVGYASLMAEALKHNIGLRDTLALTAEVDLYTVTSTGEVQPVTTKH